MTMTLPGMQKVIQWEDPTKFKKWKGISLEDEVKWRGVAYSDNDPPLVEIYKRMSTGTQARVKISVTAEGVRVTADDAIDFTLMEASDFSVCMIEAVRSVMAISAHKKGELYGPDSNGGVRYE